MSNNFSRRRMMQTAGAAALAPISLTGAPVSWPPAQGPGTPKICLGAPQNADEPTMRRYKQIGVDYVLMGGPRSPWDEAALRAIMDRYKSCWDYRHQHDDLGASMTSSGANRGPTRRSRTRSIQSAWQAKSDSLSSSTTSMPIASLKATKRNSAVVAQA